MTRMNTLNLHTTGGYYTLCIQHSPDTMRSNAVQDITSHHHCCSKDLVIRLMQPILCDSASGGDERIV